MTTPATFQPNASQQEAIAHPGGPLLIVAGAGTGKTATLTQRIIRLITSGEAKPGEILALTFTNKAVDELRQRVAATLAARGITGDAPHIQTYHAFGGEIVRDFGPEHGLSDGGRVLTTAECWILLWEVIDRIDFRTRDVINIRGSVGPSPIKDILTLASRLADELLTHHHYAAWLEATTPQDDPDRDLVRGLEVYEARKRELGAIDYGDQITIACDLLEIPEVARSLQQRFRHVLVDEFQDTNYAQSVMVQRLVGDAQGNICVVGDPNQAIYAFRGAAPDNIDRFAEREFPATRTVRLAENYRSTQAILDAANAIWGPDQRDRHLVGGPETQRGDRPLIVAAETLHDETHWIAERVRAHVEAGGKYKDVGVLVRKGTVRQAIWRALREEGIPAEAVGGMALFATPEVRELVSWLRVIVSPTDSVALAHVLLSERWGLTEADLYALSTGKPRELPLDGWLRDRLARGDAPAALADAFHALDDLVAAGFRLSLPRLVDEIIALRGPAVRPGERQNLDRFLATTREYADTAADHPSVRDYVRYLDLLLAADPDEDAATDDADASTLDTVKVMTIHAAKGLQWPLVIIAGANSNDFGSRRETKRLFPLALGHDVPGRPSREAFAGDLTAWTTALEAWAQTEAEAEQQRLLYVALTRAEHTLAITWSARHPARKTASKRSDRFDPVLPYCDLVDAPPAPDRAAAPALADLLPALLAAPAPLAAGGPDAVALARRLADAERIHGRIAIDADVLVAAVHDRQAEAERDLAAIRAVASAEDEAAESRSPRPLSYTQIAAFRACPHRYYLGHVLQLPGIPRKTAADFGTALHLTVAREASRRLARRPVSGEAIHGWFREELVRHDVADGGSGSGVLRRYLESVDARAEPLAVEARFVLRLGEHAVSGAIDRVHRLPDGATEVVDYKTNARAKTAAEVKEDHQLAIYLLACRTLFREIDPPPERAAMFFLRTGDRVEITYTEPELDAVRERLIADAEQIATLAPDVHRASPETCRWCDFRLICRYSEATD